MFVACVALGGGVWPSWPPAFGCCLCGCVWLWPARVWLAVACVGAVDWGFRSVALVMIEMVSQQCRT
mgnify:CR=1 FL=1